MNPHCLFASVLLCCGHSHAAEFTNKDIERIQKQYPDTIGPPASSPSGTQTQIYQCRNTQGVAYWSSTWCSHGGGHTVNAVSVPSTLPFKDQVKAAEEFLGQKARGAATEQKAKETASTCRAIDQELAAIWKRYDRGQFNESAMIGRDQQRTRELKAQRSRLACETR